MFGYDSQHSETHSKINVPVFTCRKRLCFFIKVLGLFLFLKHESFSRVSVRSHWSKEHYELFFKHTVNYIYNC